MQYPTVNRHPGTHNVADGLLLLAGLMVLIVSGDAFAFITAAAVIVTAAWWMIREIEHRVRKSAAKLPPVLDLRPALTGQRDLKETSAPTLRVAVDYTGSTIPAA